MAINFWDHDRDTLGMEHVPASIRDRCIILVNNHQKYEAGIRPQGIFIKRCPKCNKRLDVVTEELACITTGYDFRFNIYRCTCHYSWIKFTRAKNPMMG